jgi:hypothetical protein
MASTNSANDPLEFAQNLWGKMGFPLPGMSIPTFDVGELEKRLADLKTVEGWLKMNLSMLQATIQTLEMQCSTLNAVHAMSKLRPDFSTPAAAPANKPSAESGAEEQAADPMQSAMWPWALMQQIQTQMQQAMEKQADAPPQTPAVKPDQKPS